MTGLIIHHERFSVKGGRMIGFVLLLYWAAWRAEPCGFDQSALTFSAAFSMISTMASEKASKSGSSTCSSGWLRK